MNGFIKSLRLAAEALVSSTTSFQL